MALLAGGKALVTGAGSGIGRAIAHRLHADGAAVALLDIDEGAAAAVSGELGGALVVAADVGDGRAVDRAVERVVGHLGGLTILVNNAGVGSVDHFHRYTDEEFDRIVDVSMRGTFNGIRSAAPLMAEAGGGTIVNISSISGMRPTRGEAPYSAAKAAVIALTRSAALEYGPGLRVNCVSPGLIETPLTAPLLRDDGARAALGRRTPLGRAGTAEEVAAVVAFLCSDMASYVTGVNLPVDGGSLLPSSQVEGTLTSILERADRAGGSDRPD